MPIADVNNDFHTLPSSVKQRLLADNTTHRNIIDTSFCESQSDIVLVPRFMRNETNNRERTKNKAEVFTPTRIVKQMLDNIDEAGDTLKVEFGAYICSRWLEITCGEGAFLCTRYNPKNGEMIPIRDRQGILDRKLHAVSKQINQNGAWIQYALQVCRSTYGYEYQGDSLLMARVNALYTFMEYYQNKFNSCLPVQYQCDLAEIIAWNIWQMDGLTKCIPQANVIKDRHGEYVAIEGTPATIMDWNNREPVSFMECESWQQR